MLTVVLAHARSVPALERARFAEQLTRLRQPGSVVLQTCHRVELYGDATALADVVYPGGSERRAGLDVARHLVRVAVGRDSAVIAEDQILHQLRSAAMDARSRGPLPPDLDRLIDVSLRAGRRARSWLPARRPNLADLAVSRAAGDIDLTGQRVMVVGSGVMGRAAVAYLRVRDAIVTATSRTPESAALLAAQFAIATSTFDPGPELIARQSGIVIALRGPWSLGGDSRRALVDGGAWALDISQPPAIGADLAASLGPRLTTIDDLAKPAESNASSRLLARLDALIEDTVNEYERWSAGKQHRAAAQALESRASDLRDDELERLWQRVPELDESQRAEVERAVDHLTARLLRDPLEQLGRDGDGRYSRAARELFRL